MHHDTLCIALFVVISNVVALSSVALVISGKVIWLTCQIRKCSVTVTRSCWLSLKNFKTSHRVSRWRIKQAILLSKPLRKFWAEAGWSRCFCTRTMVSSSPTSFFQRYLKKKEIHFSTAQNQETESSITEQLIRTLWSRIWRYFTFKDTERHVDVLPDFHDPTTQHFIAASNEVITDSHHTTNSRLCSKSVISQQRRSPAHVSLQTNFVATSKFLFRNASFCVRLFHESAFKSVVTSP